MMNAILSALTTSRKVSSFAPCITTSFVLLLLLVGMSAPGYGQTISFETTPPPNWRTGSYGRTLDYIYSAHAVASNGGAIEYRLLQGPSGMTIGDSSGIVFWPASNGAPPFTVRIAAQLRSNPAIQETQEWEVTSIRDDDVYDNGDVKLGMWLPFTTGLPGVVSDVCVIGDDLYVLHTFGIEYSGASGGWAVSRWDGEKWTELFKPNRNTGVAIQGYNGDLYLYTSETMKVGTVSYSPGLWKWNGTSLDSTGPGNVAIRSLRVHNNAIYITGTTTDQEDVLMKWDGLTWQTVARQEISSIMFLAETMGRLYVNGLFRHLSPDTDAEYLAEVMSDKLEPVPHAPTDPLYSIQDYSDGLILQPANQALSHHIDVWTPSGIIPLPSIGPFPDFSPSFVYRGEWYAYAYTAYMTPPSSNRLHLFRLRNDRWEQIGLLWGTYYGEVLRTVQYRGKLIAVGTFQKPTPYIAQLCTPEVCREVSGTVYHDLNRNCVQDPGEEGVAGSVIRFSPEGLLDTTDAEGHYSITLPFGTYTAALTSKPYWEATCTNPFTIDSLSGPDVSFNLGINAMPSVPDLAISLSHPTLEVNRDALYTITYRNLGTVAASGTVIVDGEGLFVYRGSSQTPTRRDTVHVEWDFDDLQPGETRELTASYLVPGSVKIDSGVCVTGEVQLRSTGSVDSDPSNNRYMSCYGVGGPGGPVTSVKREESGEAHLTIYPNPTRGTSLISLRLDHPSNVELRLIDTKGSVVRDLLSSRLEAGEHRVELKRGNLPAGLYFVTVIRDGEKDLYPVVVAE